MKVLTASETKIDDLLKGKKLPEGSIRSFGGKKYIKKNAKWLPYSEKKGGAKERDWQGFKQGADVQATVGGKTIKGKIVSMSGSKDKSNYLVATEESGYNKAVKVDRSDLKAAAPKEGIKRASPKTTDEAKAQAKSALQRLKNGGKLRQGDRVTDEAKRQGMVDENGKVTKQGEGWLAGKKVKKPSQIKKKRQVKDTRSPTEAMADVTSAVLKGEKVYEHKLTRDQKRTYDKMVADGHAEWRTSYGSSDRYLDITPLGYVQNAINGMQVRLANNPTDEDARSELLKLTSRYKQLKTKGEEASAKVADVRGDKMPPALAETVLRSGKYGKPVFAQVRGERADVIYEDDAGQRAFATFSQRADGTWFRLGTPRKGPMPGKWART